MKKLAIICAYPVKHNIGMLTVDLSAYAIIKRYGFNVDCVFYTYGDFEQPEFENRTYLPFKYKNILKNKDEFLSSDAFLFWGDFIHANSYRIDLEFRKISIEEIEKLTNIYFLSSVSDKLLKKAVVFGGTIITNSAQDDCKKEYRDMYVRFFSNAGSVLFRDAISTAKISHIRGRENAFGCDCAFLLEDNDLKELKNFSRKTDKKGIGLFLGRSPGKLQAILFAKYLSWKLGTTCSWISWLHSGLRVRLIARIAGFDVPKIPPSPVEVLSRLSGYEFIVTDTYHLCINAWRMGIPAVCVGKGASSLKTTLNDKKKEVLYEMYGARCFYVFTEHLHAFIGIPSRAGRIIGYLRDVALINQIQVNIKDSSKMAEIHLKDALKSALEC